MKKPTPLRWTSVRSLPLARYLRYGADDKLAEAGKRTGLQVRARSRLRPTNEYCASVTTLYFAVKDRY